MSRPGRRSAGGAAALLLVLAVACGDDGAGDEPGQDLPPVDPLEQVARYGEVFEAHGLRITPRGGLVDLDGYAASEAGTHFALYVEPVEERTPEAYLDSMVPLLAAVAPDLMARYPGLESFDICQEASPPPGGWGDATPRVVTLVDLTREQIASVDWEQATLADVLAAIAELPGGSARAASPLDDLPAWQDARDEARARAGLDADD